MQAVSYAFFNNIFSSLSKINTMIEAFHDYLDSLYFEGYARQLAEQFPERYNYELNEFLNAYA